MHSHGQYFFFFVNVYSSLANKFNYRNDHTKKITYYMVTLYDEMSVIRLSNTSLNVALCNHEIQFFFLIVYIHWNILFESPIYLEIKIQVITIMYLHVQSEKESCCTLNLMLFLSHLNLFFTYWKQSYSFIEFRLLR